MLDDLLSNYTLIGKLGEGSFSEVLKVKHKKTGSFYAAKRLTKRYLTLSDAEECDELRTLQKLDYHPNVLSLIEPVYELQTGTLTLIFDLMDMSMYDYIKDRKKNLSETKCKHFIYQLAQGLSHLHRSGIFHRDIKPENILIRTDPRLKQNNPFKSELIQLGDLGSVCQSNFPQPHSAYISTRWYRAPECLLTSGYYGPKMDVWALGCCFYEFLTLCPLFPGDNELDQLHKIHGVLGSPTEMLLSRFKHQSVDCDFPKQPPIPFHKLVPMLSDFGVDVLKKTLTYHPDTRISAKKLLEHGYFKDLQAKYKAQSTLGRLVSTSLTSSPDNNDGSIDIGRKSLNNSRASSISSLNQSIMLKKLQDAHQELNKQLERGWGMNPCPVKAKLFKNIKSSVNNTKKPL